MKLRHWFQLGRIRLGREDGQTMAEYGMLVAFIAIVALAGVMTLGGSLKDYFTALPNNF